MEIAIDSTPGQVEQVTNIAKVYVVWEDATGDGPVIVTAKRTFSSVDATRVKLGHLYHGFASAYDAAECFCGRKRHKPSKVLFSLNEEKT